MRTTLIALLICAPALIGADFAGTWKMTAQSPNGGELQFDMQFDKQGDTYTGEVRGGSNTFKLDKFAVEGDKIRFTILHEMGPLPVELTLNGNQLEGAATTPDGNTKIPMKGVKGDAASTTVSAPVSAAGRWKLAAKTPDGGTVNYAAELRESGGMLTGTAYNPDGEGAPISEAKLTGAVLTFKVVVDQGSYDVSMTIEGDSAKGWFKTPDGSKGEFTATRQK